MLARPLLFLSSYSPLFVILAFRFSPLGLQVGCYALAALGALAAVLVFHVEKGSSRDRYVVTDADEAGGEAAGYLAAYVLPFVTVAEPSGRDLIAYVLFLLVAGLIYVRSSMLQVNPILFLFGFRVFKIADDRGLRAFLISRDVVATGDTVVAREADVGVLIGSVEKGAI